MNRDGVDNIIKEKIDDLQTMDNIKGIINAATNTEENKFLDSLPSNNGVSESTKETKEEPIQTTAQVAIDPVTGVYSQAAKKLDITEEMAKMLEFTEEDLIKIPESKYDLEFDEEIIKKNIMESIGTKDQEIVSQLLDLIFKYKKAADFRSTINWYEKLPEKIRKIIDKQCLALNNNSINTKKMLANELLEEIISSSSIDQISIDMQESLNKAFDTSGIMTYLLEENMTTFEKKLIGLIEKDKALVIDDPEMEEKRQKHIKLLEDIKEQYRQAYTLEGFIDTIKRGKVRVKPFDIKKYKRFVDNFYWKYEQDTPFTIQDPTRVPLILARHFKNKYTPKQCTAFIIGFFKYTANMSAKNVVDHTYMSYFISNILQLDLVKHLVEEGDFLNILSNSIEEAICAINNIKYIAESEE